MFAVISAKRGGRGGGGEREGGSLSFFDPHTVSGWIKILSSSMGPFLFDIQIGGLIQHCLRWVL